MLDLYDLIDLTHPLTSEAPSWHGICGFSLKSHFTPPFVEEEITMDAGMGTHLDAPSHRYLEDTRIDELPLESLIVPACVIDVSSRAHPDYEISLADLKDFENQHGPISKNSLVIGYTGWDRFWSDPKTYRNEDSLGYVHFPAFAEECAHYLLSKNISGIGIDTLSPDCNNRHFPIHRYLLKEGKYIIENIAQCAKLPPKGAFIFALPIKIHTAQAPARVIALVPKTSS